ncbi:hypothetical protein J4444_00830 [Candidatus Woesearchaeota archaeon]|nr:hypothetical protein [Candidatus Woesearchaeota archaeon]
MVKLVKKKSNRSFVAVSSSADLSDRVIIGLLLLVAIVSIVSVVIVYLQVLNAISYTNHEVVKNEVIPSEVKGMVTLQIIAPPSRNVGKVMEQSKGAGK